MDERGLVEASKAGHRGLSVVRGAMKSDSDQLRGDVERNEARSHWAGGVLVAGLLIEVILALHFSERKAPLANWSPVLADILVAAGVYGEIHFSGKAARAQKALQAITDSRLTEALDRAAKAENNLVEYLTPRRAKLLPHIDTIAEELKAFDEQNSTSDLVVATGSKQISVGTLRNCSQRVDGTSSLGG